MTQHGNTRETARRYGIDVSLIEANLAKSPTQRARDHFAALELAHKLKVAGENYNARVRKPS